MYSGVYALIESIGWVESIQEKNEKILNLFGTLPQRAEGIKGVAICCAN